MDSHNGGARTCSTLRRQLLTVIRSSSFGSGSQRRASQNDAKPGLLPALTRSFPLLLPATRARFLHWASDQLLLRHSGHERHVSQNFCLRRRAPSLWQGQYRLLTALRLFRGRRGNRGSRLHVLPIQEGVLWASLAAPSAQRGMDCLFYALSQPWTWPRISPTALNYHTEAMHCFRGWRTS